MVSIKKLTKVLSLLMTAIMILGTFSSFAYAQEGQINFSKLDFQQEALNKIMPEVMEDFESKEFAEVLVYMKEQVDTEMVAEATRDAVSSYMTPYSAKLEVRKGVVEALKDKAESTQANLLSYLEREKEKGNVAEYKPYHIVNMVYVKATREVVENISYRLEVAKIYKNKIYKMEFEKAEDADLELQSTEPKWNITRIGADQVWNLGINGTGIVVGQLDTGVDWTHPALKNKWRGYNPVTDEIDSSKSWFDPIYGTTLPEDSGEHGTHVMGTIVGREPDGSNPIGVAPGARWIAARVFDAYGYTTDQILLDAAEWMLHPGGDPNAAPDVVNNSWGGLDGIDDWYRDAVRAWRAAGIFPVFSAGNQRPGEPEPWPGSISVPANYPESFAVAAVDRNDRRASFSKLGPSPYDETLVKPEISAPGVNIYSCIPGGYTDRYSGTSMAAPHITGTIALMLSANASLTIDEIEQILIETADPLIDDDYPESPNYGYGYGMVNAYDAVIKATPGTGEISGTVLVEGEDVAGAQIIHQQEIFETLVVGDIKIQARVIDDVSIRRVELLVKKQDESYWYLIPMNMISGNYKDGVYEGIIPRELLTGNSIKYKILAKDFSETVVSTPEYTINIIFGVIPGQYFQGFEDEPLGWRFEGDWQWGQPVAGFDPVPYEGENLAGTVLGDNYSLETESWLITPPIDLRDRSLPTASLRFHHWYDIENRWDEGRIMITDDYGETWQQVGPVYTGSSNGWEEVMINLEDYIGSPNPIFVAFCLDSDYVTVYKGWYIDNVRLYGADNEPPASPADLVAEVSTTGIMLNWTAVTDIDFANYLVYRSLQSGEGYELIAQPTVNSFMDTAVEPGLTYYYKVAAIDTSGNMSGFTNEVSCLMPEIKTIYFEDFEEDDGGFITGVTAGTNNPWEWGIPLSGPNEAYSGEKLWATGLVGYYPNRTDAYIESPTIILPADNVSVLAFVHWVDMENIPSMPDYGQVLVSSDGGETWTNITPTDNGKYGGSIREWRNEEIYLSDYMGQDIKIRFFFHSDVSSTAPGWYIDDVRIVELDTTLENLNTGQTDVLEDEIKAVEYENPATFSHRLTGNDIINLEVVKDADVQNIPLSSSGITTDDAWVTILENGISVKVDPITGEYSIKVPAGEYTLKAEAYGYFSQEARVTVLEDETTVQNFLLEPRPRGIIQGRVFDRYYQDPIAYAEVRVIEDPKLPVAVTDENGCFTIDNVIAGTYTLKVKAEGFHLGEFESITVNGDDITLVDLGLERLVGYKDEIIYDDGTGEIGTVARNARNGLAVRFTPERYGTVKGVNIYIWNDSWPSPGGNRLGFTIYGTNENGVPYKVGEPIFVNNLIRGEWNYIDLSVFEFSTDRDFYITTVQDHIGDYCPGVGVDSNSPYEDRSYVNLDGVFEYMRNHGGYGGLMMRAVLENYVSTPAITNLDKINYTNQDSIVIEGTVNTHCKVNVYVNDTVAYAVDSDNLAFSVEVELPEETNNIKIAAELEGRETEPWELTVIKDKESPVLVVDSPIDGTIMNKRAIHVIGNVADNNGIAKLLINGEEATVNEDGSFDHRLMAEEGEFQIIVAAVDYAGNMAYDERTVIVDFEGPSITNMVPAEDIILFEGDTLTVSFNSEPGGQGYFRLGAAYNTSGDNHAGIPMVEEEPGLYVGTLVIPEGFAVIDGVVEFEFIDQAGNKVKAVAPGRVTVIGEGVQPMENLPVNAVIVGDEAYDINYLNNNSDVQMKLIDYFNEGNDIYIKLAADLIVNHEGQIVGLDALPDELVYYDENGRTTIYVK